MEQKYKVVKKRIKKIFSKKNITKAIIVISGLMLVLSSVLPFILG